MPDGQTWIARLPGDVWEVSEMAHGCGRKLSRPTAGFGPCFHLPIGQAILDFSGFLNSPQPQPGIPESPSSA